LVKHECSWGWTWSCLLTCGPYPRRVISRTQMMPSVPYREFKRYVPAVQFILFSMLTQATRGTTLAVGTLTRLHILRQHYQQAHSQRIDALAWNTHVLSSCPRNCMVSHRDVPPIQMVYGTSSGSVRWNNEPRERRQRQQVCIWDLRGPRRAGGLGGAGGPGERRVAVRLGMPCCGISVSIRRLLGSCVGSACVGCACDGWGDPG
jgi:hypothetical protein